MTKPKKPSTDNLILLQGRDRIRYAERKLHEAQVERGLAPTPDGIKKVSRRGRHCAICTHLNRYLIDADLLDPNNTVTGIAARFMVSVKSLYYHKSNHIAPALVAAKEAQREMGASTLLAKLSALEDRTNNLLIRAENQTTIGPGVVPLINQLNLNYATLARVLDAYRRQQEREERQTAVIPRSKLQAIIAEWNAIVLGAISDPPLLHEIKLRLQAHYGAAAVQRALSLVETPELVEGKTQA